MDSLRTSEASAFGAELELKVSADDADEGVGTFRWVGVLNVCVSLVRSVVVNAGGAEVDGCPLRRSAATLGESNQDGDLEDDGWAAVDDGGVELTEGARFAGGAVVIGGDVDPNIS